MAFSGSVNNYQYVPNPINWVDPLGGVRVFRMTNLPQN
ncbi:hypothetical protein [Photobacterium damselae]